MAPLILVLIALAWTLAACDQTPVAQPQSTAESTVRAPGLVREGYPGTFAYTVQPGDTLFSIAQRFGTTVEIIASLNGIDDVNDVPVGAHLFIPNPPPTPTPTPTRTAVPTGPSLLVSHGDRSSNRVALTFDMGGRLDPAVDIMNFLVANEVHATIFTTGASLDTANSDLGRQALAVLNAHPDLFDVANHSYDHPDFTTISDAEIASQLARTEASIAAHGGPSPRPWFRPPFGAQDTRVLRELGDNGYAFTIMWDIDTIDWLPVADGGPTAAGIVSKVLGNAQGGTIVLMHLGGYNTLDALPQIVTGLRDAGFELVTVAELLAD